MPQPRSRPYLRQAPPFNSLKEFHMMSKKRALTAGLLTATVLTVAGCSSDTAGSTSSASPASSASSGQPSGGPPSGGGAGGPGGMSSVTAVNLNTDGVSPGGANTAAVVKATNAFLAT